MMSIIVYNEAGEIVKVVATTGAYGVIEDFTVENSVFSPDDGGKALINVGGTIFEWDGKNNQGATVQNGVYYIKVETKDNFGATHMAIRSVTVLTNGLTAELRVFNSAGEIVKVLPVNGITDFGSNDITVSPGVFSPGDPSGPGGTLSTADITYMGTTIKWDGTNENGTIVGNGAYTIQLVGIDSNGAKTIASTDITVLHSGFNVISNVKIIPNPVDASKSGVVTIKYDVMKNTDVQIKIYNIAAELVRKLRDNTGAGQIQMDIDGGGADRLASGIYVMVIYARTDTGMTKTMIVKLSIVHGK
jgi:flagellar hook assembly protein FlgD